MLLIGWVALAGLGPFGARRAPCALASTGAFDDSRFSDSMGWTVALALAFLALAIASAVLFRHWAAQDQPVPASGSTIGSTLGAAVQPGEVTEEQQTQLNRLGIVVLVISGVVVLAFLLAPMAISAVVGAAARDRVPGGRLDRHPRLVDPQPRTQETARDLPDPAAAVRPRDHAAHRAADRRIDRAERARPARSAIRRAG